MHNILEGLLSIEMSYLHVGVVSKINGGSLLGTLELLVRHLLTHYIVEEKIFTLALLNSRILSFDYGPDVKNKPSGVLSQHLGKGHLRQSGELGN